jgi:protein O-GlcNAc transferase
MSAASLAAIESQLAAREAAGALAASDEVLASASLATIDRIQALKLRARANQALGNPRAAAADLQGVLALAPRDAQACNDLGIAYVDAGEEDLALVTFQRATTMEPRYARAWNNYGNALRMARRLPAAADAFGRAVAVDAGYAMGWANLGAVRRELGDDASAEAALARAIAINPAQRMAIFTLAGLRREQGRLDDAVELYAEAVRLDPADANASFLRGFTQAERDDLEGAAASFDAALARDSGMLRAAFARRLTLPVVASSAAAIDDARARFDTGLAALESELRERAAALAPARALDELRWSNFLLAYHGEDDRPLQQRFGTLVRGVIAARAPAYLEPVARRPRAGARVRVGFASSLFRDCTAGHYFEHWVTDLPRDRFEVFVYHLQPVIDALGVRIGARADKFHQCPRWRLSQLAPLIRDDAPDVLIYPELGMDATTFALASLALAPVQCAGWGHPVTTGLPTIDVFFSCATMEPPDAESHYGERLVRLPGIGTRYAMPQAPSDADRARWGLPANATLFLCPQSLFKIHPDDDGRFAQVLATAKGSRLVLFEGRHPALTAKFLARLSGALAARGVDSAGRFHVLPQCTHDDYLHISACCDAMLDTSRWSGGNTALDALACELPIVALPGRFMRGRQSMAMLEQTGLPELVAKDDDDYVRIAARLADDCAWRETLAARIRENRGRVFDDAAPVAALADVLDTLV